MSCSKAAKAAGFKSTVELAELATVHICTMTDAYNERHINDKFYVYLRRALDEKHFREGVKMEKFIMRLQIERGINND